MMIDDDDDNGHPQVREVGRLVIRDSAFLSLPMGAILIHSADQVFIAFIIVIIYIFIMIINTHPQCRPGLFVIITFIIVFVIINTFIVFRLRLLATKCLCPRLQQSQPG